MAARPTPAGDFDYDAHGSGYARVRQPDARIAALIVEALGDARTVVNVGAGAGSYEPTDRTVIAVEPSATMRAQRPAHLAPAIDGAAEALLDPQVRAAQSSWAFADPAEVEQGLAQLASDLGSGAWDAEYGHLRTQPAATGALRLIVATP